MDFTDKGFLQQNLFQKSIISVESRLKRPLRKLSNILSMGRGKFPGVRAKDKVGSSKKNFLHATRGLTYLFDLGATATSVLGGLKAPSSLTRVNEMN